jgi:hypothetical protein
MKKGVYINHKNDNASLCYFNGDKLEILEDLSLENFDVDFDFDFEENILHATFSKLEYLGEL